MTTLKTDEEIAEKVWDKIVEDLQKERACEGVKIILSAITQACQSRDEVIKNSERFLECRDQRIQRLKEALEPFAQLGDKCSVDAIVSYHNFLPLADCRKARAALYEENKKDLGEKEA